MRVRPIDRLLVGLAASVFAGAIAVDARAQGWAEPQPDPQPSEPAAPPAGPAPAPEMASTTSDSSGIDVELAGEVSYVTPPIRGGTNPFGAGFGARAGLVFAGDFYVGLNVRDFLGGNDVDVSYRAILYGAEVGYGLRFPAFGSAFFLLRPQVGVGDAQVYYTDPTLAVDVVTSASGSSSATSNTLTVNNVYVEPGLTLELASGAHFVAVDAAMLVLPGIAYGGADATTWVSYAAGVELGFRF